MIYLFLNNLNLASLVHQVFPAGSISHSLLQFGLGLRGRIVGSRATIRRYSTIRYERARTTVIYFRYKISDKTIPEIYCLRSLCCMLNIYSVRSTVQRAYRVRSDPQVIGDLTRNCLAPFNRFSRSLRRTRATVRENSHKDGQMLLCFVCCIIYDRHHY